MKKENGGKGKGEETKQDRRKGGRKEGEGARRDGGET